VPAPKNRESPGGGKAWVKTGEHAAKKMERTVHSGLTWVSRGLRNGTTLENGIEEPRAETIAIVASGGSKARMHLLDLNLQRLGNSGQKKWPNNVAVVEPRETKRRYSPTRWVTREVQADKNCVLVGRRPRNVVPCTEGGCNLNISTEHLHGTWI